MYLTKQIVRVSSVLIGLLAAGAAMASPQILQSANNPTGNQAYSGVGLKFHVNSAVKISGIGIYDSNDDGILNQTVLSAYLFDNLNNVVVSQSFTAADGNGSGGYIFKNIGPTILGAGDYTLMGYGWDDLNLEHNCNITGICENFNTGGGLLTYLTSAWTITGSDAPGTLPTNFGNTNYFSAANLKFEAVDGAVPEPSTLALFALAIAGLGAVRRKQV